MNRLLVLTLAVALLQSPALGHNGQLGGYGGGGASSSASAAASSAASGGGGGLGGVGGGSSASAAASASSAASGGGVGGGLGGVGGGLGGVGGGLGGVSSGVVGGGVSSGVVGGGVGGGVVSGGVVSGGSGGRVVSSGSTTTTITKTTTIQQGGGPIGGGSIGGGPIGGGSIGGGPIGGGSIGGGIPISPSSGGVVRQSQVGGGVPIAPSSGGVVSSPVGGSSVSSASAASSASATSAGGVGGLGASSASSAAAASASASSAGGARGLGSSSAAASVSAASSASAGGVGGGQVVIRPRPAPAPVQIPLPAPIVLPPPPVIPAAPTLAEIQEPELIPIPRPTPASTSVIQVINQQNTVSTQVVTQLRQSQNLLLVDIENSIELFESAQLKAASEANSWYFPSPKLRESFFATFAIVEDLINQAKAYAQGAGRLLTALESSGIFLQPAWIDRVNKLQAQSGTALIRANEAQQLILTQMSQVSTDMNMYSQGRAEQLSATKVQIDQAVSTVAAETAALGIRIRDILARAILEWSGLIQTKLGAGAQVYIDQINSIAQGVLGSLGGLSTATLENTLISTRTAMDQMRGVLYGANLSAADIAGAMNPVQQNVFGLLSGGVGGAGASSAASAAASSSAGAGGASSAASAAASAGAGNGGVIRG